MAASSLYFPATFRIDSAGILPSRCRRPSKHQRMMLVRSDLEKNVSDMSTNGYSSSSNNMASGAISHQPHLVTHSLAKNMFSTPGLSLALQTSMEGQGEVTRLGENNYETSGYVGGRRRSRDEEHESSSGSDNMDGASGDDQDADDMKQPTKKRYHRHTPQQIQELESLFKECPHPDEKQRLELSRRLSLSSNEAGWKSTFSCPVK